MREDVRAARRLGRTMLAVAVASGIILGFGWVAAPGSIGPMFVAHPRVLDIMSAATLLPIAGWTIYLVGLAWMIRIYRSSHLEPDADAWRYRS